MLPSSLPGSRNRVAWRSTGWMEKAKKYLYHLVSLIIKFIYQHISRYIKIYQDIYAISRIAGQKAITTLAFQVETRGDGLRYCSFPRIWWCLLNLDIDADHCFGLPGLFTCSSPHCYGSLILRDPSMFEHLSAVTLEKNASGYIEPAELIASLTREYWRARVLSTFRTNPLRRRCPKGWERLTTLQVGFTYGFCGLRASGKETPTSLNFHGEESV